MRLYSPCLVNQGAAFDIERDMVECIPRRQGCATVFKEGEADEVVAGERKRSLARRRNPDDAALASQASSYVQVVVDIKGAALRAAQSLVEDGGVAVAIDGMDSLIGRCGRPGDKERAGRIEGKMIGGDRRFERGEDEDLAAG